ncbi:DUF3313 domain-containing protein [Xanthomonas sp. Kuri4-3]
MPYAGLASSRYLQPSDDSRGDRAPYAYQGEVDWAAYSRVILEPVTIYRGADAQFEKVSEEQKQQIARYMQQEFNYALSKRYYPTTRPGPGTLRVRLLLTGAEVNKKVIGTVMKFDLAGAPYNAVQAARGREGAFSGSVSYAVEIYDTQRDALLAAYVEKQYPSAMNPKASLGTLDASKAGIRKGAEALIARLQ